MDIFGIPIQAFMGQLMLGLVNGSFYAMLSLGLAVIFGLSRSSCSTSSASTTGSRWSSRRWRSVPWAS
jgi:hypothetical protein